MLNFAAFFPLFFLCRLIVSLTEWRGRCGILGSVAAPLRNGEAETCHKLIDVFAVRESEETENRLSREACISVNFCQKQDGKGHEDA